MLHLSHPGEKHDLGSVGGATRSDFMRICGANSVLEALKSGKVSKIYYSSENPKIKEIIELARRSKIPVYKAKIQEKICAEISPLSYSTLESIAQKAMTENSFILVLDNVNDPQNLGACIRSAEFFGCAGVVIKRRRAVQITEGVVRASMGSVFHIKIACEDSLANAIRKLKDYDFFVVGADLDGRDLRQFSLKPPIVIVIGGEDKGISPGVKKLCDEVVKIPGVGKMKSLNLSVSSAIIMFEVFKSTNLSNL
ncbi:MAG: 23S rRNA (guanosine(2251)-2'-O)-methyltransferase RlmB [Archaeoglobaceae archaeon]|nr:23S rRNA (guanosine(2251)-2'-O)-methyltransferase RlmB [Archaeoglobaceae archaeon]MDW8118903.1 23S rRNA (guanosine(2251)-2'-O)-methyltransferase RlmB [Archaeoglobaceae archaeon]